MKEYHSTEPDMGLKNYQAPILTLAARYLAMFDNYHLPRKNARFDIIILRGRLWGGRFQMAVIGGRQVTGGMAGNPQKKKSRYVLDMEGFWLSDKFRIRADSEPPPQPV
jgi:hypothetical protein